MADLPLVLVPQTDGDLPAIERLNERAFGPGRFARSAYRLREGVPADPNLSFVARVGSFLVGSNVMTPIRCGKQPALLLGPLTVDPAFRSAGIGEALINKSLEASREAGHRVVLLVGDLPYYGRMGFKPVPPGQVTFCGPVDPARLLYLDLVEGAFATMSGLVSRARL
jgi:predicted N-acetyltransferase YhbS